MFTIKITETFFSIWEKPRGSQICLRFHPGTENPAPQSGLDKQWRERRGEPSHSLMHPVSPVCSALWSHMSHSLASYAKPVVWFFYQAPAPHGYLRHKSIVNHCLTTYSMYNCPHYWRSKGATVTATPLSLLQPLLLEGVPVPTSCLCLMVTDASCQLLLPSFQHGRHLLGPPPFPQTVTLTLSSPMSLPFPGLPLQLPQSLPVLASLFTASRMPATTHTGMVSSLRGMPTPLSSSPSFSASH